MRYTWYYIDEFTKEVFMKTNIRLRKLIKLNFDTMEKFADAIGLSRQSLSYKLNNKRDFKASDIKKIKEALSLTDAQVNEFFFSIL